MTFRHAQHVTFATGSEILNGFNVCLSITITSQASSMVAMEYEPSAAGQESYILCADCGTVISSANGAGLCECHLVGRTVGQPLTT